MFTLRIDGQPHRVLMQHATTEIEKALKCLLWKSRYGIAHWRSQMKLSENGRRILPLPHRCKDVGDGSGGDIADRRYARCIRTINDSRRVAISDNGVASVTPSQRALPDKVCGDDRRNTERSKGSDSPMWRTEQTGFFILVRYGTHVPAHNFKIRVLAGVIDCHLEHAEVEVGDWAKRPACDQYDGLLFWMALKEVEAMVRKGIVRRCSKTLSGTTNAL